MSPLYLFVLPSVPLQTDRSFARKLRSIDWIGAILATCVYTSISLLFTSGGSTWGWSSGGVIALYVLLGVLSAVFVASQIFGFSGNIISWDILKDLDQTLLFIIKTGFSIGLFVAIYYTPLFFLFVRNDSPIKAAIRLLPLVCFFIFGNLGCSYAVPRVGHHAVWLLVGGILFVAGGAALLAVTHTSTSNAVLYGLTVLIGAGAAPTQITYGLSTSLVPAARRSDSLQIQNLAYGQGNLLGLIIASAIFQNTASQGLRKALSGLAFSDNEINQAIGGVGSSVLDRVEPRVKEECIEAIVRAIRYEWILTIVSGVLIIVCASVMILKRRPSK